MQSSITNKWKKYKNIIDEINAIHLKNSLFPSQVYQNQIKELRNELFDDYECFINVNNIIHPIVLKNTVTDWFKDNCKNKSKIEIEKWWEQQNIKTNISVRNFVDENIGQKLCQLCLLDGTSSCPPSTNCANQLAQKVVKNSEKYIHIPNTQENFELFLTGSTNYLKKEMSLSVEHESPIEVIMFEALLPVARKYGYELKREYPVRDEGRLEIRYSLDMVFINQHNKIVLDIECDGLTYHNGFDSMTNDRIRDRWLLIRGIPTMRFTSREIFNDLDNCVVQVEQALKRLYHS